MITTKALAGESGVLRNGHANGHFETLAIEPITALTPDEKDALKECEHMIATRLRAFFEVGEALIRIKEGKLYRSGFSSFDDYCHKRWDFNRLYAYRLLHAAEVRKTLAPLGLSYVPDNERQLRPLVGLPPKVAEKAWIKAVELAQGKSITGAIVIKAVRTVTKSKEKKSAEKASWQLGITPLLKKALRCCKNGDREKLTDLFNKMQLLLEVGVKKVEAEE